jgi:hypothetical protein
MRRKRQVKQPQTNAKNRLSRETRHQQKNTGRSTRANASGNKHERKGQTLRYQESEHFTIPYPSLASQPLNTGATTELLVSGTKLE